MGRQGFADTLPQSSAHRTTDFTAFSSFFLFAVLPWLDLFHYAAVAVKKINVFCVERQPRCTSSSCQRAERGEAEVQQGGTALQ